MTSPKETKKNKILVLGSQGQLGISLIKTLGKSFIVEGINKKKFNFLEPENFLDLVKSSKAKYVINAAAYTNVEQAETEVDFAKQINGEALKFIAQACNKKNKTFHFSTDYVFDGAKVILILRKINQILFQVMEKQISWRKIYSRKY